MDQNKNESSLSATPGGISEEEDKLIVSWFVSDGGANLAFKRFLQSNSAVFGLAPTTAKKKQCRNRITALKRLWHPNDTSRFVRALRDRELDDLANQIESKATTPRYFAQNPAATFGRIASPTQTKKNITTRESIATADSITASSTLASPLSTPHRLVLDDDSSSIGTLGRDWSFVNSEHSIGTTPTTIIMDHLRNDRNGVVDDDDVVTTLPIDFKNIKNNLIVIPVKINEYKERPDSPSKYTKVTLTIPQVDARDYYEDRYAARLTDGGRSIVITMPAVPAFWCLFVNAIAKKKDGKTHGNDQDKENHESMITELTNPNARENKRIMKVKLSFPGDMRVSNNMYNNGATDQWTVVAKLDGLGSKYNSMKQSHFYIYYDMVVIGSEQVIRAGMGNMADLTTEFEGIDFEEPDTDPPGQHYAKILASTHHMSICPKVPVSPYDVMMGDSESIKPDPPGRTHHIRNKKNSSKNEDESNKTNTGGIVSLKLDKNPQSLPVKIPPPLSLPLHTTVMVPPTTKIHQAIVPATSLAIFEPTQNGDTVVTVPPMLEIQQNMPPETSLAIAAPKENKNDVLSVKTKGKRSIVDREEGKPVFKLDIRKSLEPRTKLLKETPKKKTQHSFWSLDDAARKHTG